MKPLIIPALLTQSAEEAVEKYYSLSKTPSWIQIDILDGTLYPEQTWHDPKSAAKFITSSIELHLMVKDPGAHIRAWKSVKNLKRVLWHIEAPIDHKKLIASCRKQNLEVGLAIAPETSIDQLTSYIDLIDELLVLGVHPGKSGQKLSVAMKKRVEQLHALYPKRIIGFDGGITAQNIADLKRRGVSCFCVTHAIFAKKNPNAALGDLRERIA